MALLVLPWVHPWAPGPQPNTVPLLISWACVATLMALSRWPSPAELARAWAWAALISSAIGLVQYFGMADHFGGWVHLPASFGEAMGNLRQRNQLATHLGIGIAAVLWWHRQGLRTAHALWMLALLACATAATNSRTGLLQMLVLPALLAGWAWNSPSGSRAPSWRLALWTLLVYLLASGALPQLLAGQTGTQSSNALVRMGESYGCGSRKILWANVLQLIAQKPWTGWGWGELKYAHYMASYPGERFCEILGNAHNLPLQLAVELGVPLTLTALLGLLALLWRARPWRLQRPTDALAWGVLLPIGLHSLLEYPLWYGPFQIAALWAAGLLWPRGQAWLQSHRQSWASLALAGLCLIALLGWDYLRVRQIYLPAAQRTAWWQDDPWQAAQQSWFFGDAARFAWVTSSAVTPENAQRMRQTSEAMLHYSPEPRVVDKLIESARLTGHDAQAAWHQRQRQVVYGSQRP